MMKGADGERYPLERCPLPVGQGVCLVLDTGLAVCGLSEVSSRLQC